MYVFFIGQTSMLGQCRRITIGERYRNPNFHEGRSNRRTFRKFIKRKGSEQTAKMTNVVPFSPRVFLHFELQKTNKGTTSIVNILPHRKRIFASPSSNKKTTTKRKHTISMTTDWKRKEYNRTPVFIGDCWGIVV
jgi:hypothetical protein